MKEHALKAIYITAGTIFFILGIIGVFLPVMPTTPFLLLTAFCWVRGSERLHSWLISHKTFGPPIRDYMQERAMQYKTKVKAILLIWTSICFSIFLTQKTFVTIILLITGTALTLYLLSLKTLLRAVSSAKKPN